MNNELWTMNDELLSKTHLVTTRFGCRFLSSRTCFGISVFGLENLGLKAMPVDEVLYSLAAMRFQVSDANHQADH